MRICPLSIAALLGCALSTAIGVDGVTANEIALGQSASLSGATADLGTGINIGLQSCLNEVNLKGGIHGRRLRLVAIDDGYDPTRCLDAVLRLIEEDKIFCLTGLVGTPTAKIAEPVISEAKVPVIGLFTGAGFLRQPVKRYVFNVRASYNDETESLVERLIKDLGSKRIAVFYQNDAFGRAGLSGTEAALKRRGLVLVGSGAFERGTLDVQAGLAAVVAARPDAVVMVGPAKPVAAFVRAARLAHLDTPLATISFVGTETLIRELSTEAENIIISQVVPSPVDLTLPLVKEYQTAIQASFPEKLPSYVSLEGYVYGRVLCLALERAGRELSRERLVDTLDGLAGINLGGMNISLAKDNHQASNHVFITQVSKGRATPIATIAASVSPPARTE